MAMGMPAEKSLNFGPSLKRLLRRMRGERTGLVLVFLLAVGSVAFAVIGPKILGNATNIIYDGFVGRQLPAGLTKDQVIAGLRAEGHRVGLFRPITLWPFPGPALLAATQRVRTVLVLEINAGQMLDDVRAWTAHREGVRFIGGVSIHESGLSYGPLLDAPVIRERILTHLEPVDGSPSAGAAGSPAGTPAAAAGALAGGAR